MGWGGKYRHMPTPESVVFWAKIGQRVVGMGIGIIALLPENLTTKIITVILGGAIAISRDIEDGFGVKVHGSVAAKDVEVIKDEAIKIIIFVTLINTYLFNF